MNDRRYAALMVAVILIMYAPFLAQAAWSDPPPITCIAHRGGAGDHTESTAGTFAEALTAGVLYWESDVRWSDTDYPYLLHDASLSLFGHPEILLADVSGATATSYTSASGDHLMSLYELRQLVVPTSVHLQLELKTMPTAEQWIRLASRLDPIRDRVTLSSFSPATVRAAQDHGYRTALLAATDSVTTLAPTFIVEAAALTAADVSRHRAVGVDTQTYTPDTVAGWQDAAGAGVTAIITNQPAACEAWEAAR